ncbi:MAG TPA: envelope stress response membrane protein PspB [Thioploca sp.]|nr:MAG: envelope stress response membrane protein PspB [Gammaproteobacteria bacterium]HDN27495.1 envelope stress response membrane protein PspB [Thioploca sp.]
MIKTILLYVVGFMLLIGFMLFIVPLWLGLHYRWKTKKKNSLSEEAVQRVQALQNQAEKLEQRVKVLESILDQKVPNWKKPQ